MARYFDRNDAYVRITDHSALTLPDGDWSMGGWVRVTAYADVGRYLIGAYTPERQLHFQIVGDNAGPPSNKLQLKLEDNNGTYKVVQSTTKPGESRVWQHVLAVRTSNVVILYNDGAVIAIDETMNIVAVDVNTSFYMGASYSSGEYLNDLAGDMAEWAKWDVALNSEQRAALVSGVRPVDVGTRPAWYIPMLDVLEEEVAGLVLTNIGTTASEHPPMIVPAGQCI